MNIFAYTGVDQYPGYVSINRMANGDVSVTVREAPTIHEDGVYVCSYQGGPGRCTPGGSTCNNYCNMAPEKGPMMDRPLPCRQVIEGRTVRFVVPADRWTLGS